MGSKYIEMAGISHVEMFEEAAKLGFVTFTTSAVDVAPVYFSPHER
jgi:hypothetical protein